MDTRTLVEGTIREHGLDNWLVDYPWLICALGDPKARVWFLGENPSMKGVREVHERAVVHDENLQWNSHVGDKLLREAITEAGLKEGDPAANEGWHCFITNVIKAPEVVAERNAKKRKSDYWKDQAAIWMPTLQAQIDAGQPRVLVCLGREVEKILKHMIGLGLRCPALERIQHYSYIMLRPESGTRRGPRDPERIREFKSSIADIAARYGTDSG